MELPHEITESRTPIQQFYKNSNIFITGATGFLGRLLVEKLLRACPDISKIYILVRDKKGKDIETRLRELFSDACFERLHSVAPNFREKVVPIMGDVAEPNLGLSAADRLLLIEEVTLVFHSAATVNFVEKLQSTIITNVRGTRDVLALCEEMKSLKFMVHVSSAYSNCHYMQIEEKFYPPNYDPKKLIVLAENLPEDALELISEKLRGTSVNSYSFSKSAAEDLTRQSKLPAAVYRPSIIISTYKEPLPGWINNFYGPQGVGTGAMVGLLRTMNADEDCNANIVPVDMCVNFLIAIPWECCSKYDAKQTNLPPQQSEVPIYHYESSNEQPISWKRMQYLGQINGQLCASMQMVGMYFFVPIKNAFAYKLAILFMHILPAIIVDAGLLCLGKKPMLRAAYNKIHKFTKIIAFFATRNWVFKSERTPALCQHMDPEDRKLFFCDLKKLDWDVFFRTYVHGCRRYLLKESPETIPEAERRYYTKIMPITYTVLTIVGLMLAALLWYTTRLCMWVLSS